MKSNDIFLDFGGDFAADFFWPIRLAWRAQKYRF